MKKKVAVIFNTNQLGGAERSLLEQFSLSTEKDDLTFFIPKLNLPNSNLLKALKDKGLHNVVVYPYPRFLYNISQDALSKALLILVLFPSILWHTILWNNLFKGFDEFYANGNKASFLPLCWALVFRKNIDLYWHFRDFPSGKFFKVITTIIKVSKVKRFVRFHLIGNSAAVAAELKKYFPHEEVSFIYNLAGDLPSLEVGRKIRTIGIASMLTDWKGLHSVLLMLSLFEKELKGIGIEKIIFFGKNIYQTADKHLNYPEQIRILADKLGLTSVEWGGQASPVEIFSNIDLLIHPSIRPEPFGRVILEAYKTNTPVISTGLGGAYELVGNSEWALVTVPHDYRGLYEAIRLLVQDDDFRLNLVKRGALKAQTIELEARQKSHNFRRQQSLE